MCTTVGPNKGPICATDKEQKPVKATGTSPYDVAICKTCSGLTLTLVAVVRPVVCRIIAPVVFA